MIMNVGGGQTTGSLDLLDLICMALKFPDNIIIIGRMLLPKASALRLWKLLMVVSQLGKMIHKKTITFPFTFWFYLHKEVVFPVQM